MKKPVWDIFFNDTDKTAWIDHSPNYRFAILNNNPNSISDDLVHDKETGLIWPRNASILPAGSWWNASSECRTLQIANRLGWRLPTVEELCSLIDRGNNNPALPTGHPFISVQCDGEANPTYWTSTNVENPGTVENPAAAAWFVNFFLGEAGGGVKDIAGFIWPVRGGRGGVTWHL